jgi:hypothetical protein
VTKLKSKVHVAVATLFKSHFSEGSREVGGGYRLIEKFAQSFPLCLEVNFR